MMNPKRESKRMQKKLSDHSDNQEKHISRRRFLRKGSIGLAAAGIGSIPQTHDDNQNRAKIKYAILGRTGMKVANIGYGSSRGNLDPSMIAYAVDKGINYFDTSEGYGRGQSEIKIGKAVKKFRDKIYITTKVGSVNAAGRLTADTSKEEILDRVAASLQRLDTPYIDCLMLHGAGDPDFGGFDNPNLDAAFKQLKTDGNVRFFGISTHHHNLVETVRHAVESNKVDVMLLAYNYLQRRGVPENTRRENWLRDYNTVVKLAHEKNIGITAMKTLQGAQGASAIKSGDQSLNAKKAAVKWALNNPDIDVAVISMSSMNMIDEMVSISESGMEENDWESLETLYTETGNSVCRIGCPAPCMESCPHDVAIPDILRMNMYFEECRAEKQAMLEYAASIGKEKNAGLCGYCSSDACTDNCQYDIPVRRKLIESHENLVLQT